MMAIFCISLLTGCSYRNRSENTQLSDRQLLEEQGSAKQQDTDATEHEELDNGTEALDTKVEMLEDIDDNGQCEKVIYSGKDGVYDKLDFYFNEELIYERDGADTVAANIGSLIAYEDIDHDGEKEIIFTMSPYVNSMPLMEYAVLKNRNGIWEPLQVYHGKDIIENTFPISVIKGAKPYEAIIGCEGIDKTITFDVERFYSYKAQTESGVMNEQEIDNYLNRIFEIDKGQECGSSCAWGVWNIQTGELSDGTFCLIAEQGIQGESKFDFWGSLYIYFDYDINGNIQIKDLKFE